MPNYGVVTVTFNGIQASYSTQQGIGLGQLALCPANNGGYRWAENGAAATVAGNLYQASAAIANHQTITTSEAAAAGASAIGVVLGASTATVDQYKEGTLLVEDDAGEGIAYPIAGHAASASSTLVSMRLPPNVTVEVATTTSTTFSLVANPYKGILIHPSPATAQLVGVPNVIITASEFGWVQTLGLCAVLTDGTVVINEGVIDSPNSNGAISPSISSGSQVEHHVGIVSRVGATTEYSLINLSIG